MSAFVLLRHYCLAVKTAAKRSSPVRSSGRQHRSFSTGLSFELTDDQKAFQGLARKFASEEIIPKAAEHDLSGEYPHEIFAKAWELGLCNPHIPESCGGLGLSTLEGAVRSKKQKYQSTVGDCGCW